MKSNKILLPLFLSLGSAVCLSGCGISHINNVSTNVEKRLNIDVEPVVDYYQYDSLDTSSLVVSASYYQDGSLLKGENDTITDYTLSLEDGTIIQDGYVFKDVGTFKIIVSKEGYSSTSFTVEVVEVSNLRQTLTLASLPTKRNYFVGDHFDASGLSLTVRTNYRKDNRPVFRTDAVKDYSLSINGREIQDFTFGSSGPYTVTVTYQGLAETKTVSFTVYVYEKKQVSNVTTYQDDSIRNYWDEGDGKSMTISFQDPNDTNSSDKGYYSPDEVDMLSSMKDLSKRGYEHWKYTPSTGQVPLLVVPVVIPGNEKDATAENMNYITKAFFGDSSDLYFESLHSYYYKSSYGQLDFSGMVTDFFYPESVSDEFTSASSYTNSNISDLAVLAANWAKDLYGLDMSQYDSDNDGCIDGIWLVYLHDIDQSQTTPWWAFTSTTSADPGTLENPTVNTYGWAGIDFINGSMITDYAPRNNRNISNADGDAHVIIHETGHMLGLSDYYSYEGTYSGYDPLGGFDMMDYNVGDQNPYSKMMLGWTKPYVVTGNANITIPTYQHKDAVIVIPYDDKYKNVTSDRLSFNVFDEYLVLDYYTYENLYAQHYDGSGYYMEVQPEASGALLYHVDARLFAADDNLMQYLYGNTSYTTAGARSRIHELENTDDLFTSDTYKNMDLIRVISNSERGNRSEYMYGYSELNYADEVRLISADRTYLSVQNTPSNSSLFRTNSSFSFNTYSNSFITLSGNRSATMDNGKTLSKTFTITNIQ